MKDRKKIIDSLNQAKEAVKQANEALDAAVQELDDDALNTVTGGENPYEDYPRVPTQPIDPNIR